MSVFARSDLAAVTVSPAHGGCGRSHVRPAPGGNPVAIWELKCDGGCEDHLRKDPHWATTVSEIPETHDEVKVREDYEKRGAKDKDAVLAAALAKLAGVELPESLTRMSGGAPLHIPGTMECPLGHAQAAGAKFCAECGSPMHGVPNGRQIAPAAPPAPAQAPAPAEVTGKAAGRAPRLRDARRDELAAMARERGLSDEGTRGDLISRLTEAGVTSNDYAGYLSVAA